MNDDIEKVEPFDSFAAVYKVLNWSGYYRLLNNQTSGSKRIFHKIYRMLAFLIVLIYNGQHLMFIAQNYHDLNKLVDCLMIEIPLMNLLIKLLTIYYQTPRIEKLNNFLQDDTTFHASDEAGQSILRQNKETMYGLSRLTLISITIGAFFWPSSYFVRRYTDPREVVPLYVPFPTDTWAGFSLSVLIESSPILWVGYGHLFLDCLVATYYAQVQTQLRIIKQRLECFVGEEENYEKTNFQFRDLIDVNVRKRFILIVKRYEKLIWYKNKIDSIFNCSLSFQFFSTTVPVCLIIYRMTIVSVTSFPFLFLVFLICILLTQVFLHCYFGNLVEFESRSVNNSLYHSDWLSLSPLFRRQLLIAMIRWSRPLQPQICYVIPLSLNTFITIVKSSYTLYTVLVANKFDNA